MLILNNEHILSRSGPAKSINLLKESLFKNKKNIYCYRNVNPLFFDVTIGNKTLFKKKLFYLISLMFKQKLIFINGIYSMFFFILPIVISFLRKKKIVISPRGQIAPESLVKKKFIKLLFFKILTLIQIFTPSKFFWLVTLYWSR